MLPTVNIHLCSLCRVLGFRHCSLSMLHLFSPHTPKLPFIMTKVEDMSMCTFVLIWGHRVASNEDLIEIDKAILTNQRKPYETKIKSVGPYRVLESETGELGTILFPCVTLYILRFRSHFLGLDKSQSDMVALAPIPTAQFFWLKFPVDSDYIFYFPVLNPVKISVFCVCVHL